MAVETRKVKQIMQRLSLGGIGHVLLVGSYSRVKNPADIDLLCHLTDESPQPFTKRLLELVKDPETGLAMTEAKGGWLSDRAQVRTTLLERESDPLDRLSTLAWHRAKKENQVKVFNPTGLEWLLLRRWDQVIKTGLKVDFFSTSLDLPVSIIYRWAEMAEPEVVASLERDLLIEALHGRWRAAGKRLGSLLQVIGASKSLKDEVDAVRALNDAEARVLLWEVRERLPERYSAVVEELADARRPPSLHHHHLL
jgi:hypothetical protein